MYSSNDSVIQWLNDNLLPPISPFTDASMLSRKGLIPRSIINRFLPEFISTMNGLAMELPATFQNVFCATFLSDEVVDEVCSFGTDGALLLTHHLFDMDCGFPGQLKGVPFHFISEDSFYALQQAHVAIYACHLPLDRQECPFNTSLAFSDVLEIPVEEPLQLSTLPNIGYKLKKQKNISAIIQKKFPLTVHYGKADLFSEEGPTAIVAGVISRLEILDELSQQGFRRLICGDVLVRIPSLRYETMVDGLKETSLSIFCVSHLKSERCAMRKIAQTINSIFSHVTARCVQENSDWK